MKNNLLGLLVFSSAIFSISCICAMFTNSGTMSFGRSINIAHVYFQNNGTVESTEKADISVKTLAGSGLIKSRMVTITCDNFEYTGEIAADECTISTKNSFNFNMFKRSAEGKYKIIITKDGKEEVVVLQ